MEGLFRRLAVTLKDREAVIVHLTVFGAANAAAAGHDAMQTALGRIEWPVNWIEGAACTDHPIAGVQVFACGDTSVQRLEYGGRVVGSVFERSGMRQCFLGGMTSRSAAVLRSEQSQQALETIAEVLAQAGFDFNDIIRTWFFLDDMLSWYGDFNRVRTRFYAPIHFQSGSLPASTGVAGRNPAGSALVAAVWAVRRLAPSAQVHEVVSPLQCSALQYGSSFSRAMELASDAGSRLLISGTASIASSGETLWTGNVRRQVALTMEVVEAILRSRGFQWSDLTRATAYFKHPADVGALAEWMARHETRSLPVVPVHCDICRDDLLFELEADAWKPGGPERRKG